MEISINRDNYRIVNPCPFEDLSIRGCGHSEFTNMNTVRTGGAQLFGCITRQTLVEDKLEAGGLH